MILFSWRDGAIGIGVDLPAGAIELARGGEQAVRALFRDLGGQTGGDGGKWPRLPGVADDTDANACEVLRAWMRQEARTPTGAYLAFNHALDLRFVGQG